MNNDDLALEKFLKGEDTKLLILDTFRNADNSTCDRLFAKLISETKNQYALYLIGRLYMDGLRCKKDTKKGLEYYMASAEYNNSHAQNDLGVWYEQECMEETNGAQDCGRAFHWYTLSAEQNHGLAMENLSKFYEEGTVVKKDMDRAIELYMMSFECGDREQNEETINFFTENIDSLRKFIRKLIIKNKEKDKLIEEKDKLIEEKDKLIEEKDKLIEHLKYCPRVGFKEAEEDFNLLQARNKIEF